MKENKYYEDIINHYKEIIRLKDEQLKILTFPKYSYNIKNHKLSKMCDNIGEYEIK